MYPKRGRRVGGGGITLTSGALTEGGGGIAASLIQGGLLRGLRKGVGRFIGAWGRA